MWEHNVLAGTDGPYHNVFKIRSPVSFDVGNEEFLVDMMESILEGDFASKV